MTKSLSITLLCILLAIIVFLGVFAFFPVVIESKNGGEFYSPMMLLQKSVGLTDTVKATYQIKLNEGANADDVAKALSKRLTKSFGYYSSVVTVDGSVATIEIPVTNKNNDEVKSDSATVANADRILGYIGAVGKVEILTDSTYDATKVVLSEEHFGNVRLQSLAQDGENWYICRVGLTKEGRKVADSKLSTTSQYYCAVDGTISYGVLYTGNALQIHSQDKSLAKLVAGYIVSGAIGAELTMDTIDDVENNVGGLVFGIVMAVVVLASWIFFAVRYKTLGIAGILSQAIAAIIYITFAGLVHSAIINLYGAIAIAVGYLAMTASTIYAFEKIRAFAAEGKTYASARYNGFRATWKLSLVVHAAVLVLGIILWVIPSAVTTTVGCVLVYAAVLSCFATMGLNRLFTAMLEPLAQGDARVATRK